ncbi:MAG: hypothetical protein NT132_04995 [Microbacterium sp.]|uniref:hypothetical protein n=1 Tax=Microbacterium sp. TaxID=51671 RepID=UPI00260D16C6|nr:hypothetical protein [Microbacterium sp.]MCX6501752.1 hypothetical protein [Microbacterium sp.]
MPEDRIELWWLPVGAGGHVVIHTSAWWEHLQARRERRSPQPLYHAALEVFQGGHRHLIEMTPAWSAPVHERGVVATGPVGARWLGFSRFFRYEVRCWADGILPDREWAVASPATFPLASGTAEALIARVGRIPAYTWGRDALGCGDMWNSNSLASWLLLTAGIDAERVVPPSGGRAPGWRAGLVAGREERDRTAAT